MAHLVSLIGAGAKAPISQGQLDLARRALERTAARLDSVEWLSPAACDIPFEGQPKGALSAVRSALADAPLDVNVVPAENRRKKLLLADMDSTLIEQECIDELAAVLGIGARVAAITERAMRGEIAFEPALRERVALLRGLSADAVDMLLEDRISISPGAAVLVATMRAAGAHTALVSGGFTSFAGPIATRLGFHEHRANTLSIVAGRFAGELSEPILGRAAKEEALRELSGRLGLDPADTLAVGDGANDAGMVQHAGLGVAYRGKPALRAVAHAWVDHGDLTALLYLQGFRREEFVSAPPERSPAAPVRDCRSGAR